MLIKELFSEYIADIPNSVGKGELLKLTCNEAARELRVYASFDRVQQHEYILDFENAMKKALELNGFTLECRYAPTLFNEKCMPDIVLLLKKKMYVINGHFEGATYSFSDNTLTVDLNGPGYSILKKANVEAELEKLIRELFTANVKVIIKGEDNASSENDYEKQIAELISSMPAPADIPPENGQYPAFAEDDRREDTLKAAVYTVDLKDLPILSDGAKLIKGRTIDSPITNIADINGKAGNVTVWGDVFTYADKTIRTKNGEKRVVTVGITDYTSSISVKDFENANEESCFAAFKKGGTLMISRF